MHIRLLLVALLFSACCTKKYCTIPMDEMGVRLVYQNFSQQELSDMKIYMVDDNYQIIDSTNNYSGTNVVHLYESMTSSSNPPVIMYNYIAAIANRRDTISSIKYDIVHDKIACNQCFPFGDGRSDVTRYENFRFDYKGSTVYADSVVIVK